ncbi:MAG: hypothetical protein HY286_13810 [Planctomycetes bacterium]|nr:hypothetical protein [Planctomycetota bacterium]
MLSAFAAAADGRRLTIVSIVIARAAVVVAFTSKDGIMVELPFSIKINL